MTDTKLIRADAKDVRAGVIDLDVLGVAAIRSDVKRDVSIQGISGGRRGHDVAGGIINGYARRQQARPKPLRSAPANSCRAFKRSSVLFWEVRA